MRRKILPYAKHLKAYSKKLRKEMTLCEKILWDELKGKKMMGFDFDRQRPIDNYIVDFYCKDLMLAIEVDGSSHSYDEVAKQDKIRQKKLEELGVRFLRFDDDDIKGNINGVLEIIKRWIEANPELVGRIDGVGHPPPSPSKESHPPPSPSKEGSLIRSPHESLLQEGDLEVGKPSRKKDTKFHFKQFSVRHDRSGMKVGTDGTLLGAWTNIKNAKRILDIGSGTGLIALMLAQRAPGAKIEAIEIDSAAIEDAQENFAKSPWKDRLTLHHMRLQDFKSLEKFDLIVSNPPYFIGSYKPPDEKRITARHAESLTFQDLIDTTKEILTENGSLTVVLPPVEGHRFIELAEMNGLFCSRKWTFRTRLQKPVERLLLEFTRKRRVSEEGEILLYDSGEEWSVNYKALTQGFYLKL